MATPLLWSFQNACPVVRQIDWLSILRIDYTVGSRYTTQLSSISPLVITQPWWLAFSECHIRKSKNVLKRLPRFTYPSARGCFFSVFAATTHFRGVSLVIYQCFLLPRYIPCPCDEFCVEARQRGLLWETLDRYSLGERTPPSFSKFTWHRAFSIVRTLKSTTCMQVQHKKWMAYVRWLVQKATFAGIRCGDSEARVDSLVMTFA